MTEARFSDPFGKAWNEILNLCQDPGYLASLGASLVGGDGLEIAVRKNRSLLTLRRDDRAEIFTEAGALDIRRFKAEWASSGEVLLVDISGKMGAPASVRGTFTALINKLRSS